jgi:hypothetical protein
LLCDALAGLRVKEILSFEEQLRAKLRRAYTFDVMAAAFIVKSYISDDTFEDFRAWLVAQGKEHFERAVKAPAFVVREADRQMSIRMGEDEILAIDGFAPVSVVRSDAKLYWHREDGSGGARLE